MATISVTPDSIGDTIAQLTEGDTLQLLAGTYSEPLILSGLYGKPNQPITIRAMPGAVFNGGTTFEQYEPIATREAWRKLEGRPDRYPSLFHIACQGMIRLQSCHHIRLENLQIRRCWPTGIYMNDVLHIHIDGLDMEDGTFAIYVEGESSSHILI